MPRVRPRVAPLAILALAACKPTKGSETPGEGVSGAPDSSATDGEGEEASDPDAPPTCADDGAPWDGKAEGCLYEHGGCCYGSPESVCAAAGCAPEHCRIMESSPAQARCEEAPADS